MASVACPTTNTIADFVCRKLDDTQVAEVEAHASDCAVCRQLIGTLAAASLPRFPDGSNGAEGEQQDPDRGASDPHRYVIRRELFRGGMGRISIAEDTLLHREVAIKELLAPSTALAARFHRELALTSRLQHPSIVSIHDGGTWPSGEPFYVMRLVSGQSLDRVIARHASVAARIGLLPHGIAMVDALAYAHSEGIIHRDLKPANILVGDFGETVVIDWGLARDLRAPDGDERLVVGTPAYMAPEQARGEVVDERSDVYALGAVLYHMFAGAAPYSGTAASEIVRAVVAAAPVPLAERAALPPDLLAIVDKAMARDPKQRYGAAGELAGDLKRFQQGQLVGAHRYSTWELARRWLRRHRTAVAVATVGVLAVAVAIAVGFRNVVAEQRRAEQHRADADELMTFMLTDLHDRLKPLGKLELLGAVATKARDYYRAHDLAPRDRENRFLALANVGEVLYAQGDLAGAVGEMREALTLAEELAREAPADVIRQRHVASSHIRIGSALIERFEIAGALAELRAGVAVERPLADSHPTDASLHQDLAHDLAVLGSALEAQGDSAGAMVQYREALAIAQRFTTVASADPGWLEQLAESHARIGEVLRKGGHMAEALVEVRAALAAATKLVARDLKNGDWQVLAVDYHVRVGQLLEPQDPKAALAEYRAAQASSELLVARDATNARWRRAFAMSASQVGDALFATGDPVAALDAFRKALASEQQLAAALPGNAGAQRQVLVGHGHIGEVLLAQNQLAAALDEYQAGLAIATELAANDASNLEAQADLANMENNLGLVLVQQGKVDAGLVQLRAAAARTQRIADRDPDNTDARHALCAELLSIGDATGGGLAEYRAAATLGTKLVARSASDQTGASCLFDSHTKLGDAALARHAKPEALSEYRAALATAQQLAAQFPAVTAYRDAVTDCETKIREIGR
jgi:tetratricopeptide (TPR) repeat protein